MDILYAIIKTGGYLISLGIIAIVPALFIAALMTRLPWIIAAPAMAFVAFVAAYPAGMLEGIRQERAAWELVMQKERQRQIDNQEKAQFAINETAAAHRVRERNIRRGNTTSIIALNETIHGLRLNISDMEESEIQHIHCINSKVPVQIVDKLNEVR